MKISNGMNKFVIFFFSIFLLFFAQTSFAAELNFSPASGSYHVGDTINVRIVLSSPSVSANAVSGTLSFPSNLLTLNSISKSGSLISLWAVEPSYSNGAGTANMEGIILNGYKGSNGTILTLSFKAKAVGNPNIKFTSTSILANDGEGTSITGNSGQANFSISKAVEKVVVPPKPTPKIGPEPAPAPVIAPTPEPIVVKVLTPVFTDYSKDLKEGEFLVVKGLADSSIDVVITSDSVVSSTDKIVHETTTLKSNDKGAFAYVSDRTNAGIYMITAQARNKDGVESEKSLPIKISVAASLPDSFAIKDITNIFSIVIPIVGLLILLILLIIWGKHKVLNYRQIMHKKLGETEALVSKSFGILDEDVREEVKIFKKVKGLQPLTGDEHVFINQFKKDLEASEKTILEEMSEIRRI